MVRHGNSSARQKLLSRGCRQMGQTLQHCISKKPPRPRSGRKLKHSELVGIEVELEHVPYPPKVDKWVQHADDSLKVEGIEYTILTWHEHAKNNLQNLFSSIRPNISTRCSVHVHINALDMSLENIKTFLLYYMVFEKALYNYSGKRWKNIFCVPLNTWYFNLKNEDSFFNFKEIWSKYAGLNLETLFRHGTIEFRQMTGNTNALYITTWINMIVNLKKYVMGTTYDEAVEKVLAMNSTSSYWDLISDIFKNDAPALMYNDFQKDIESCITHAKLNITDIVYLDSILTEDQ
jgi:hypothetical protein